MAECISCSAHVATAGQCPCGGLALDPDGVVSIVVPLDVLRLVVGYAERFVALVDDDEQRQHAGRAFYFAADALSAAADAPLTMSAAIAARLVAEVNA